MPNYAVTSNPTAIYPGDTVVAFNAETPTPPQASKQFCVAPSPWGSGAQGQFAIQIQFAAAPTAVVTVQSAAVDADADYITTGVSSTNKQFDVLSLTTNSPFIRVQLTSETAGGAVTVTIFRIA